VLNLDEGKALSTKVPGRGRRGSAGLGTISSPFGMLETVKKSAKGPHSISAA